MAFDTSTLTKARESGYSDDEVISFAAQSDPRIKTALDSGYSIDEVASYFDPKPEPTTPERPAGELGSRFLASAASGALDAAAMVGRIASALPTSKVTDFINEKTGLGISSKKAIGFLEEASGRARDDYGVMPEYDKGLASAVASGAGSLLPIVASGGTLAPFTGAAMAGEQGFREAEEKGGTQTQKIVSAAGNAATAFVTEKLLGLPALLKSAKAAKIPTDTFAGMVKSVVAQVGKGFVREGTQETLEQVASDVIAKNIAAYDPDRDLFDAEKLGTTFLAGGIVGGGLGGVIQTAENVAPKEQMKTVAETVDQTLVQTATAEPPPLVETPPAVTQTAQGTPILSPEEIAAVPPATEAPLPTPSEAVKMPPAPTPTQGTPDWLSSQEDFWVTQAENQNLIEKIEELSAQRLTARQVADRLQPDVGGNLSDSRAMVYAVRNKLGIPSMDQTTEFETWLASRGKSKAPPTPSLTQGTEFVGTAINTPQGVVTREQGTAHPEMLMEALDKDMPETEMESNLGFAFRTPDGTIEWVDRVEAGKRLVESGQLKGFKVGDKLTSEHIRGEVEGVTFSQAKPTADQAAETLNPFFAQAVQAAKAAGASDPESAAQEALIDLSNQVAEGKTTLDNPKSLFTKAAQIQGQKQLEKESAQKRGGGKVVSSQAETESGTNIEEQAKTDVGPRAELVAKESAKSIQDVVDAMPENDRKVMNAFMVDPSLTIEEMAEETGLTVDQVKKAKARGRKELEQFVRSQNIGDRMAPGASNIRELKNAQLTLASDIYEGLRQSDQLTKETFQKNVEQQYPELFTQEQMDEMWTLAGMASESFRESGGRKPMNKVIDQMAGGKMREGETSRKNEIADQQRRARGLPAAMQAARKSHQSVWDDAMRAIDYDPQLQSNTVAKFKDSDEVPTDFESAILLHATIEAENKFDDAVDRVNEAATDQDRIIAQADAQTAERELIELYDINKSTGTAAGRALSARRMMSDRSYTLSRMIAETRAKKGEDLTPQEQADVKENFETLNKSKAELDARELQKDEEVAREQAEEVLGSMSKDADPVVKSLLDRIVDRLKKAHDAARERILARLSRTSTGLDPTVLYDLSVIGAYHIAKGIKKLSDWKRAMNEDLEGAFEEHYDQVFEESNRRVDEAVEEGTKTSPKKEKVKRLLKDASMQEVLDDTRKKMANRIKEGDSISDLRSYVQKMALALVRGGTTQLDPLLDTLHTMIEPISPGITRREVMDLFSGYGDSRQLDMEQAKVTVRDLKGQSQQLAKIEDIPKGIPLKKTGVERRTPSDTERRLIKQVNELAKVFGIKVTDPATQLRSILSSIKTRLQNDIKDLTHQIETGEKPLPRTPAPTNQEIENLRAQKKELQEILAKMNKGGNETEILNRALKAYKARVVQRMADLQSRIAKNDFATKKRRELDLSKDAEAVKLRAEYESAKREFENRKLEFERKNETTQRKALRFGKEVLNVPRAVKSSFDLSAVLRQGGFIAFGNPVRAAKAMKDMFQAFSQKGFEQTEAQIRNRPNFQNGEYQKSKLYLASLEGALDKREEAFRSELADKIPGVKLSNRAYIAFLNRLRADSYDALIGSLTTSPTLEQKKAIAHFVNVATGRGDLGSHGAAAETLSTLLWSPRLLVSRMQLLAGEPLLRNDAKGVRKVIVKEYAKTLAGAAVVISLGLLAGADIEEDPRSSDFGKLKFGNTRMDPWFGLQQITTLGARTGATALEILGADTPGMKTQTGKVYSLRAKEGEKRGPFDQTYTDVAKRFLETKLTPLLGGFLHEMSGQDVVGKKSSPLAFRNEFPFIPEIISPLSFDELIPVMEEQGIPRGTAMQILNLFGMSVQHQEP